MEILHLPERSAFEIITDGHRAYLTYVIKDNALDVRHTFVPNELRGKGLAALLVKAAYDHARNEQLTPMATCSYAVTWLERHPEYKGVVGADYGGEGTCAL